LNNNLFYIICFQDLRPNQINENDFIKFLKTNTEKIKQERVSNFPILLKYPENEPLIKVLIVNPKKPVVKPPDASDKNWYYTLEVIRKSIQYCGGRNHFFIHTAPLDYDLKKRLENLMERAAEQMDRNNPNILIIYTREAVLGDINEVYKNCKDLFREHNYTIIDAVVINVEDTNHTMHRSVFERPHTKLPIRATSIL